MNINKSGKKFGFIFLETISGLGFAFLGAYIFSFFDKGHLTSSILNTFLIIFLSITIGIGIVGYFHLKSIDKLPILGKSIFYCCIGLIIFLIIYVIINSLTFDYLPHYISSLIMPVILPLIGGVLGFNFLTIRSINN